MSDIIEVFVVVIDSHLHIFRFVFLWSNRLEEYTRRIWRNSSSSFI